MFYLKKLFIYLKLWWFIERILFIALMFFIWLSFNALYHEIHWLLLYFEISDIFGSVFLIFFNLFLCILGLLFNADISIFYSSNALLSENEERLNGKKVVFHTHFFTIKPKEIVFWAGGVFFSISFLLYTVLFFYIFAKITSKFLDNFKNKIYSKFFFFIIFLLFNYIYLFLFFGFNKIILFSFFITQKVISISNENLLFLALAFCLGLVSAYLAKISRVILNSRI